MSSDEMLYQQYLNWYERTHGDDDEPPMSYQDYIDEYADANDDDYWE